MDNKTEMESYIRQYNEKGVAVIANAIPIDLAEKVRAEFIKADYDRVEQQRRNYFGRVFENIAISAPASEEVYSSEFHRSRYLENSEMLKTIFESSMRGLMESLCLSKIKKIDLRAYKMEAGGHFRTHIDDYAGRIGFIWYLSKGWKWDWGGLLLSIDTTDEVTAFLPRWNQLLVIDHRYGQIPHVVTAVATHAKEPRYMLVGFLD
jgi:Rps23 Pro-64 3,4-dihydroxylase Tpa1-like proline 4-hydroxylase